MKLLSPLRYPGGKAGLAPFLTDVLDLNDLRGVNYYEPYAGGAGAALSLLSENVVRRIFINDADWRVYAFWKTVLDEPNWFVDKIMTAKLDLAEWRSLRETCLSPQGKSLREVGYAAFYMNRCNRSGVLNSGPIGGYEQSGEWKLDVRFTKPTLIERILEITKMRSAIEVSNQDAVLFLKEKLPTGNGRKNAFVYLDPPYVVKGQRLYLNAYEKDDHGEIAAYMRKQKILPWVMSYDDTELVRRLYQRQQMAFLPINYSLQEKRSTYELVIAPHHVRLPRTMRIGARSFEFKEITARNLA